MRWGNNKIAIDLGTANSVIFVEGQGVVLQEPTVVALHPKERKILAVGVAAQEMLGKVPEGIEACRPLQHGSIAHYRATEALLKRFLAEVLGRVRIFKPEVIIAIPAGLTSVEERAVMRALNAAGAGKIYLLPEPIAAAIGADLPIHTSAGNMIVNVGGGTAEVAVLSMNGLVAYQSLRGAGDAITQSIIDYLRKEHNLLVGEQMGERVKMTIGAVVAPKDRLTTEVKGRDSKTGMPASIEISADELIPAVVGPIKQIIGAIQKVLEQTPPELAADIIDRGIAISGGTALLYGIDQYFTQALNVPVFVVDEPLLCVTRGLSTVLEDVEAFKRSFRN